MAVHLFGIRHHGPGSARSLVQALRELRPEVVLIEGPPDAEGVLPLVEHAQMRPPVAILIYVPDAPAQAVYYPFAEFSPEWQALRYALAENIPVRLIDLPQSQRLALEQAREDASDRLEEPLAGVEQGSADPTRLSTPTIQQDPLQYIAQAAGYSDGERWWEHMVETRRDGALLFQGIAEAMSALRTELGDRPAEQDDHQVYIEQLREASMRRGLRAAQKQGYQTIAVICGAWHVPALLHLPAQKQDNALLKGLPRQKVEATWVPWTYQRLTLASGYGAGVHSPGWYEHLWVARDHIATRWLTQVARRLREQGIEVSSAHVIEAVRLAETLASLRGRPLPALEELNEAVQTVMLFGEGLPMQLIEQSLIVGERLGEVPEETPRVPLQQDLLRQQRSLRLKAEAGQRELVLDLRRPLDRQRSHLLQRLALLNIPWGQGGERAPGKGTFKERWKLHWQPEFDVQLIEAGVWGNTIEQAATRWAMHQAQHTNGLAELSALAHGVMLADLQEAVDPVIQRVRDEAALAADVTHLMSALPELARLSRYGDVRQTSVEVLDKVLDGLIVRLCIGLPGACRALNEEAAQEMFTHLEATHAAVLLLDHPGYRQDWYQVLQRLLDLPGLQGILQGRCCRLLLSADALSDEAAAQRFSLALSTANDPAQAASWVDGFLRGSGQVLIYDETLWQLIHQWVASLSSDAFTQLLPVLRRTFSTFTAPERRQIGERVRAGQAPRVGPGSAAELGTFDIPRAEAVLPLVSRLLGLETP